jgi:hypothetical protein
MRLSADGRKRLDAYLEAIDKAMEASGSTWNQRRSVTDDVEAQALEMLSTRSGAAPGLDDVETVIGELDPPEAYAAEVDTAPGPAEAPPTRPGVEPKGRRFSREAIVGACCAPLVLVVAGLFWGRPARDPGSGPETTSWLTRALAHAVLGSGMAAPLLTTFLGIIAISKIRHSAGRVYGLGLALFDALLFPLLLLDASLIGWPHVMAKDLRLSDSFVAGCSFAGLLVAIAADVLIVWLVWRAIKRPVASEAPSEAKAKADTPGPPATPPRAKKGVGAVSLALAAGGPPASMVLAAMLYAMASRAGPSDASPWNFIPVVVFFGCEIPALALGIAAWSSGLGKAGATTAGVVLALSIPALLVLL